MVGAKIYTTLFPCNECTKALIQSGISEVIYISDKYAQTPSVVAAKKMMKSANIIYRPYQPIGKDITLSLQYKTRIDIAFKAPIYPLSIFLSPLQVLIFLCNSPYSGTHLFSIFSMLLDVSHSILDTFFRLHRNGG